MRSPDEQADGATGRPSAGSDPAASWNPTGASPALLPGRFERRFAGVFAWWTGRMLRADFAGVRLARENASLLVDLARHPGPIIAVSNHCSWWDPLVLLLLHRRFLWGRPGLGPVESEQWRRFGFMKRIGMFGIDAGDPRSGPAMVGFVLGEFRARPNAVFWITPQARFADVREGIRARPGAAMVAAAACAGGMDVRAVSVAIEYVFWVDRRPEVLVRLEAAQPTVAHAPSPRSRFGERGKGGEGGVGEPGVPRVPSRTPASPSLPDVERPSCSLASTASWHRAISRAMRDNQAALAALSMARDAAAFEVLVGRSAGSVNAAYDLWQRVRGRGGGIEARRRNEPRP